MDDFKSLLNKKSNMIIVKIGMVTGYWPDPDSLSQVLIDLRACIIICPDRQIVWKLVHWSGYFGIHDEDPQKTFERESIENGKMIGIEKYEIKNENIYYYIKKGDFSLKIAFRKNTLRCG